MRPCRYRVWDTDLKQWVNLATQSITLTADYSGQQVCYGVSHVNSKSIKEGHVINMQYTGLYDDAGQEVCEFDICFAFKKGSGLMGYYNVVWDRLRGRWAYKSATAIETYQVGKAGNIHCKVIGNIFDNPNLDDIRKLG